MTSMAVAAVCLVMIGLSSAEDQMPRSRTLRGTSETGRRLEFVNMCTEPMVLQNTGGNTLIGCWNTACPAGLTCNPDDWNCYFDLFEPPGGWTIDAGSSLKLSTPNAAITFVDINRNEVTADWSGKVSFFVNFSHSGGSMPAAFCNNKARCNTFEGIMGVATAAEFTLVPYGPDFYDVSIINGMNVGIEMKPDADFTPVSEEEAGSSQGYNCGAAGAAMQNDQRLSNCSWLFNYTSEGQDLSPLLVQVDGGGGSCNLNADCASGLVCGQVAVTVINPTTGFRQPTTSISMECGRQIGTWSAWQLCVWSGNTYVSPDTFQGLINCPVEHNMFGCDGPAPWITTCYPAGGDEIDGGCCGCAEWEALLQTPVPCSGGSCKGSSEEWTRQALPFLEVLKRACPSSYVYPFDDETSTFTCQSAQSRSAGAVNDAGYVITLCPENAL